MQKEIVQYQTRDGKVPFREWLLSLKDIKTRARIRARLDRLALGNFGDFKSTREGIFELRCHFGPGHRIYFGQEGRLLVVLLTGGDKSSQSKDMKLAKEFWEDYKRRKRL